MVKHIEADVAVHTHPEHGEGPAWDDRDGSLLWVDIPGRSVHRHHPRDGTDVVVTLDHQVSAAVPRARGGLLLAVEDGLAYLGDGEALDLFAPVEADDPSVRFNDAKCDPAGRFWAGTMAFEATEGAGRLYRLQPDGSVEQVLDRLTVSNGMAWTSDRRTMYFIDSPTAGIDAFDYDLDTGTIRNRRQAIDLAESRPAVPDGMTIDAEDCVWVAMFGAGQVRRYIPDGRLDRVVPLPLSNPTSCVFGGADLAELYITTSTWHLSDEERAGQPLAGAVFCCRPGVAGTPTEHFRG